jgi:phosphonate transport system substrate-binding protein
MNSHKTKVNKKGLFAAAGALAAAASIFLGTFGEIAPTTANLAPKQSAPQLLAKKQDGITIVFPTRKDAPNLQIQANKVANFLSKDLGITVKAQISDETAAVEALRRNSVDIAFLSSRPALKAEELANARLHLGEIRAKYSGRYTYCSVFLVPKNSSLRTMGDRKATLAQLRGKKMAFTSPTSSSGFLYPTSELIKYKLVPNREGLDRFFGQVAYGGDYTKAIMEVVRGRADVAAVSEYAQYPPYITDADRNKLRVLYKICGVPAHGVVFNDEIPVVLREKIIKSLLKLNKPENNDLLKGLYNSTELVRIDHNRHLQLVREAVKNLGMD